MWKPRRRANALLSVLTFAALSPAADACGPFLPSRILVEANDAFLELPYSTFSYEARRVPDSLPAAVPRRSPGNG